MPSAKTIAAFPAGDVQIPPSKSLSHRAVICAGLAALSGGEGSALHHLGDNDDIRATVGCMEQLGARFERRGEFTVALRGGGPAQSLIMDCGESGSTLRFLLPLAAALGQGPVTLTGRGRLMARPLQIYRDLFGAKGLPFEQTADSVTVRGPLPEGEYAFPGDVSSQFVSGLLLALPLCGGDSVVCLSTELESSAYVEMTLSVMACFGVAVHREGTRVFRIPGGQRYRRRDYTVEGDCSQAAFFLAAGALGRDVRCLGMNPHSLQGDAAMLDILRRMGALIEWRDGAVQALPARLCAAEIDAREIPDLVPALAVLCSLAEGTSRITGAGRLRIKESDRLRAMASELQALGADVAEGFDSLTITGRPTLSGGAVDAHGDHRIAMAMAVAAIGCSGPVRLTGWEHVNKSYPRFWDDFEKERADG